MKISSQYKDSFFAFLFEKATFGGTQHSLARFLHSWHRKQNIKGVCHEQRI